MVKTVFILFFLFPISFFGQEYFFDSTSFFKKTEEIDYRMPTVGSFKRNFENDSLDTTKEDIRSLTPNKIFTKSSTIFDVTKIILMSKGRFVSYYRGCTAEGVTAGNYQITHDTLIISSSKKVYVDLKQKQIFKSFNYRFFDIGTIKYKILKEGLIYLK